MAPNSKAPHAQTVALIVASAMFMQNLDSAIINTSLPRMAQSFSVTTIDLSLGITAYMLASAAISPLSGWLADRFGSRDVLMAAVLVFTLASVGCGMAGTLPMFVAARLLQGAGAAPYRQIRADARHRADRLARAAGADPGAGVGRVHHPNL
jgi:MFS family permease